MTNDPQTTALRQFDLVRFAHERDGGPVHRVVSVMHDGMVELHDIGGYFAPHLFAIADDIGGIPPSPKHQLDGLLEPGAAQYDALTSIAISLKRIADAMSQPDDFGQTGSAALATAIRNGIIDGGQHGLR